MYDEHGDNKYDILLLISPATSGAVFMRYIECIGIQYIHICNKLYENKKSERKTRLFASSTAAGISVIIIYIGIIIESGLESYLYGKKKKLLSVWFL